VIGLYYNGIIHYMASLITVNYENAQTHPNIPDVFDIESGI